MLEWGTCESRFRLNRQLAGVACSVPACLRNGSAELADDGFASLKELTHGTNPSRIRSCRRCSGRLVLRQSLKEFWFFADKPIVNVRKSNKMSKCV